MMLHSSHTITRLQLTILFSLFLLASIFGVLHHELWLDEAHHWLLARDSDSLIDLIKQTRNEGHPVLWNMILYGISRITTNPLMMQLVHVLITSLAVFVFLKKAPLSLWLKVFFIFGYYMFFEYTLLSRNYGIGLLFLFLACSYYSYRHQKPFVYFGLLTLACNTHAMIAVVSCGMVFLWGLEWFKEKYKLTRKQGIGLGIFFLGLALAAMQVIPPSGNIVFESADKFPITERLAKSVIAFFKGILQFPDFSSIHFWNTNFLVNQSKVLAGVLSLGSLIIPYILFYKNRRILAFIYCSIFMLMAAVFVTQFSFARHQGVFMIILVIGLWLSKYHVENPLVVIRKIPIAWLEKTRKHILLSILILQCLSGIGAYAKDIASPFTQAKRTIHFLEQQDLDQKFIASRSCDGTPLSAYLQRPIYFTSFNSYQSYCIWGDSRIRSNTDLNHTLSVLERNLQKQEENVIFISYQSLLGTGQEWVKSENIQHRLLESFEGSIINKGNYYIYEVALLE